MPNPSNGNSDEDTDTAIHPPRSAPPRPAQRACRPVPGQRRARRARAGHRHGRLVPELRCAEQHWRAGLRFRDGSLGRQQSAAVAHLPVELQRQRDPLRLRHRHRFSRRRLRALDVALRRREPALHRLHAATGVADHGAGRLVLDTGHAEHLCHRRLRALRHQYRLRQPDQDFLSLAGGRCGQPGQPDLDRHRHLVARTDLAGRAAGPARRCACRHRAGCGSTGARAGFVRRRAMGQGLQGRTSGQGRPRRPGRRQPRRGARERRAARSQLVAAAGRPPRRRYPTPPRAAGQPGRRRQRQTRRCAPLRALQVRRCLQPDHA